MARLPPRALLRPTLRHPPFLNPTLTQPCPRSSAPSGPFHPPTPLSRTLTSTPLRSQALPSSPTLPHPPRPSPSTTHSPTSVSSPSRPAGLGPAGPGPSPARPAGLAPALTRQAGPGPSPARPLGLTGGARPSGLARVRPLPPPPADPDRTLRYIGLGLAGLLGWYTLYDWLCAYDRSQHHLFRQISRAVRLDPAVRTFLGHDQVLLIPDILGIPRVSGTISTVTGHVDLAFPIETPHHTKATVHYSAVRPPHATHFQTLRFKVIRGDGRELSLMEDPPLLAME